MPAKVFVPDQYSSEEPGNAFPSNDEFGPEFLGLLSDGNPNTGIKLIEDIPHTFGFTNWDIVDPYTALSNFTFEIDVSGNSSKVFGNLFIRIAHSGLTPDAASIIHNNAVNGNGTYSYNPTPTPQVVFLPPSTVDQFNSITINVQTNDIADLRISAIRTNLTSNIGGKVIVSGGYVLGRQGKISI